MDDRFPILIIEDDEDEAYLLKIALQKAGAQNPFHICPDGVDALAYLRGQDQYADRSKFPFPRVLFIDLKLPRLGGFELLDWLRNHVECSVIPTIVFTASNLPSDIKKAYQLGANAYLIKPTSFDRLVQILQITLQFWEICEKPEVPPSC